MAPDAFDRLHADMLEHMKGGRILRAGPDRRRRRPRASPRCARGHRTAWHNAVHPHLLRRPEREELDTFRARVDDHQLPQLQGRSRTPRLPHGHGDRAELSASSILIGGTEYAGENKKSVFTLLNYILPGKGVMPMHCSANHANGDPATPPSSSACRAPARRRCRPIPSRTLIGDDEHGWSDRGTFNFEGGCYAKTINLSREAEPEIYATTRSASAR
jgi:phosphoenolpyruvate carboxykinase (ATP)